MPPSVPTRMMHMRGLMHGCSLPQFHRGLCNGPTELPSRKKRKQEGSAQPQPFAAQRSSVSTIPQQCPHECPLLSMRSADPQTTTRVPARAFDSDAEQFNALILVDPLSDTRRANNTNVREDDDLESLPFGLAQEKYYSTFTNGLWKYV